MLVDFQFKENYNIDDLLEVMKILRSPEDVHGTRNRHINQ